MVAKAAGSIAKWEIHAKVMGEDIVYLADEVMFGEEGWLTFTPKAIVTPSNRQQPKNIQFTLPIHSVQLIKRYLE